MIGGYRLSAKFLRDAVRVHVEKLMRDGVFGASSSCLCPLRNTREEVDDRADFQISIGTLRICHLQSA